MVRSRGESRRAEPMKFHIRTRLKKKKSPRDKLNRQSKVERRLTVAVIYKCKFRLLRKQIVSMGMIKRNPP
jgi:hypothetical protein